MNAVHITALMKITPEIIEVTRVIQTSLAKSAIVTAMLIKSQVLRHVIR